MHIDRYRLGRPSPPLWDTSMSLYVCQSRYNHEAKTFKKIKAWESCLPELVKREDYRWIAHEHNARHPVSKVASPFIRGVQGTGGIEEADELVVETPKPIASPAKSLKILTQAIASPLLTGTVPNGGTHQQPAPLAPSITATPPIPPPPQADLPPLTFSQTAVMTEKFERLPRSLRSWLSFHSSRVSEADP